ncbi:hypothetical protein HDU76_011401 [Blyttiomyces sp. JEL0837]|nr:hypothetical protein HDU76_011401 [Blyttiomyces sp. JEL0837]
MSPPSSASELVFVEPSASDIQQHQQQQQQQQQQSTTTTSSSTTTSQSSTPSEPRFPFTPEYVAFLNARLASLSPQEIVEWALVSLPGLIQTTAFGLTGLAILDIISKVAAKRGLDSHPVPLVFIDTLYHFEETLNLAHTAASKYNTKLHIYKPDGFNSAADFEAQHGTKLWERDADIYDYLAKVEPGRRANVELKAQTMITGRRRSQGASRSNIPILEIDSSVSPPMLKLNVLASWDFDAVWKYITENGVPYNVLHDKGYKSVGDWHSTQPTAPGQNERDGRWAGTGKTECGLHKDYFKMRSSYLAAKKRKAKADAVSVAGEVEEPAAKAAKLEV